MKLLPFFMLLMASYYGVAQSQLSTVGTEFWIGFMQNHVTNTGETLTIHIGSEFNTSGTLSIPASGYSQSFTVAADQVTEITLANGLVEHYSSMVVENKGILIETQDPVNVFMLSDEHFSIDGSVVLPIQSLGSDYRVTSAQGVFEALPTGSGPRMSEFLIIATEDSTQIEIIPKTNTSGGGTANVPFVITLNRGQSYQVKAAHDSYDLSGTQIHSAVSGNFCKPFAVFNGNQITNIPNNCTTADHLVEQSIPVNFWGNEFLVVPFGGLSKHFVKVTAEYANTKVVINNNLVATLSPGQYYQALLDSTEALCVATSENASVTQYIPGSDCILNRADPAMVNINDRNQLLTHATFLADTIDASEYMLSVITETPNTGQIVLDGTPLDSTLFTPFNYAPGYSFAKINIGKGVHTIDAPMGIQAYVYAYAMGTDESYAYSLGGTKDVASDESTYCIGDSTVIGITTPLSDAWWYEVSAPGDTIASGVTQITVFPASPSEFILEGYNAAGCLEHHSFEVVAYDTTITASVTPAMDTICMGSEVTLNVDVGIAGSYTYQWSPASDLDDPSSQTPVFNGTNSEDFFVNVFDQHGCVVSYGFAQIHVDSALYFNPTISAQTNPICLGDTTMLSVTMEKMILTENFNAPSISPLLENVNGVQTSWDCIDPTVSVLFYFGSGTRSIETVNLDLTSGGNVSFLARASGANDMCNATEFFDDFIFEYSIDNGASWSTMDTLREDDFGSWTNLEYSVPANAQTSMTKFRWRQLYHDGAYYDVWLIDNIEVTTYVDSGFQVSWANGPLTTLSNSGENVLVYPDSNYVFTATIVDTLTQCSYPDSIEIIVAPAFNFDAGSNITLCDNSPTQIISTHDSPNPTTFEWLPENIFLDNSLQSPEVWTTTSTVVHVSATSQGCTRKDSLQLIVGTLYNLSLTHDSISICLGDTTQSPMSFEPQGCIISDTCSGQNVVDGFDFTGGGTNLGACPFNQFQSSRHQYIYKANELDSVGIYGPCILNELQIYVNFLGNSGNYENVSVRIGCTDSSQFSGNFITGIPIVASASNILLTQGWNTIAFDNGYIWDGTSNLILEVCYENDSGLSGSVGIGYSYASASTIYSVGSAECESTSGIISDFRLNVRFDFCPVSQNTSVVYSWSPAYNISSTTQPEPTFWPETNTLYEITVTDSVSGCVFSDSLMVISTPPSSLVTVLQDEYVICLGDTAQLQANSSTPVIWSNGSSLSDSTILSPIAFPTSSTMYTVETTNDSICFSSDTTTVHVSYPDFNLGSNSSLCNGDSVTIGPSGISGYTYNWLSSNVAQTTVPQQTVQPSSSTLYILEVTDTVSCSQIDSVLITVLPSYQLEIFDTLCFGDGLLINGTYQTSSGSYYDSLQTSFGCDSIVNIQLTIMPEIQDVVLPDAEICTGQFTYIFGVPQTQAGTYYSTQQNQYGCDTLLQQTLVVNPAPNVSFMTGIPDTMCSEDPAITFVSNPAGGVYSGTGMSGNTFDPGTASAGWNIIEYAYTNSFGCTGYDTEDIYVANCAGLEVIDWNSLIVQPNPFELDVTIHFPEGMQHSSDVFIYDASGRIVYSKIDHISPSLIIDGKHLSPGMYQLVLVSSDSQKPILVRKLIRQ